MGAVEAARLGHELGHTDAMKGLLWGLAVGFALTLGVLLLAGATIATGGAAAVFFGALIAGTAGGGLAGMKIGAASGLKRKGKIDSGSENTFLGPEKMPAARAAKDTVKCDNHQKKLIAQGSQTVFVNRFPAARKGDRTQCDGPILEGVPTVFFGGEVGTYVDIEAEVPPLLVTILVYAAIGGAVLATGGAIFTVGIGAALGGLGGSLLFGWGGAWLGGTIGEYYGGEQGQAIGEAVGGFLGGLLGGGLGARGGRFLESRLPTATLARMPGATPEHIAARMQVAREYYTKSPDFATRPSSAIKDHISGIDFTRPVAVRTINRDTVFGQFQNRGQRGPGNYIARPGTRSTSIGIGSQGRDYGTGEVGPKMIAQYRVPAGTRVLVSTASPKNDPWAVGNGAVSNTPGSPFYEPLVQSSRGGGQQMMIGDKNSMTLVSGPRIAEPALLDPGTPTTFSPGRVTPTQIPVPTAPPGAPVPVRGDGTFRPPNIIGGGVAAGSATGGLPAPLTSLPPGVPEPTSLPPGVPEPSTGSGSRP